MQTENDAYIALLCSHLDDMIQKVRTIPTDKWDWTPHIAAPSARIAAEHAWVWLVTDRQHLEQPDITKHQPVPATPTDQQTLADALQAERDWWRAKLPTLTANQFLEERFQFGTGPMDVRSLIVHITQQTIYKNGQIATLFFALGLDGEEAYTAPDPNEYYGKLAEMLASPIYSAILQDNVASLTTVLAANSLSAIDTLGEQTPLQIAAMRNRAEIVSLLLEAGADANVADEEGNTSLLYAAAFGYTAVAQALLQAGADPHKANNWNATPLQVARGRKHAAVVALLEESGAEPKTE